MKVYNVQVNHLTSPTGIDGENLRITWCVEGGIRQSAFCVEVRDSSGKLTESSDKMESNHMYYILQQTIPSRSEAVVTVRVWDENGTEGESAQIKVVTGMDKNLWRAAWINPELTCDTKVRKPASYLKKVFHVENPGRVMLYITSHGIFNAYINGQEITDYQLMPGTTQENKRLMVETLDVSSFVKSGENTLVVTLGDGWHRGSMGHMQNTNVYGTDVALLCQMENDGEIVLVSDESWQASNDGPLGKNDMMAGEEYDARKELSLSWHAVKTENFGYDNLICVDTLQVLPQETFEAKLIITPKGEKVLDFGQNLVGYVRMEFEASRGQKLQLIHGETLDKDGNFTIDNFQNPQVPTKQEVLYICKQGHNVYHPTKTYFGFRYVKLEADFPVPAEAFTAVAIYSDMRTTAFFHCGIPEVNRLFENALWSMKGNFVYVPTDCPTREKSGYSGDCQAFVYTATYLMDCYAVYVKWIREQAATQNEEGCVAQVAPMCFPKMNIADGGVAWCDSFEIIPFYLQRRYGDDTLTKDYYEQIKKWMNYQIGKSNKPRPANLFKVPKKYRKYVLDNGWVWGEWCEPGRKAMSIQERMLHGDLEVSSAYLAYGCAIVADLAKYFGKSEDEAYYREISEKAKEAYRCLFMKNGKIEEPERQCCYVRPIALNLLDEDEKKETAEALACKIEENGSKLNTGFLTTHELCRSLTRYGQEKIAYDLLLQRETPGWLYPVLHGATTILENWDGIGEDGSVKSSLNHYSYGAIAGWMMDCVGGIRVEDKTVTIQPYPDERLGFAEAVYESPYGKIVSAWKYENGKVNYHVEIPANVTATLCLDGKEQQVGSGVYDLA